MTRSIFSKTLVSCLFTGAVVAAAPARAEQYAAIAYSPVTGAFATIAPRATEQLAESEALQKCSLAGPGCQNLVWVVDGCVALAVDQTNPAIYGYYWMNGNFTDSYTPVGFAAQDQCKNYPGSSGNCAIVSRICTQ